jgi:hypothetical protein
MGQILHGSAISPKPEAIRALKHDTSAVIFSSRSTDIAF